MRRGGVAVAIAGPCLVVAVGFGMHSQEAGTVQGRAPAAHVVQAPAPSAPAGAAKASGTSSHTVAKAVAARAAFGVVRHLVPHHVPYAFRLRIFRRPRLFRRY